MFAHAAVCHLSIHMSMHMFICVSKHMSVHMSTHMSMHMFIYASLHMSIHTAIHKGISTAVLLSSSFCGCSRGLRTFNVAPMLTKILLIACVRAGGRAGVRAR